MKIRTDFVSNSSSSSFIVKENPNLPKIFTQSAERFGFDSFCDKWLDREITEVFQDACSSWFTGVGGWSSRHNQFDIWNAVRIIPDDEYVKAFVNNCLGSLVLPESCKDMYTPICECISEIRQMDDEPVGGLYENGKCNSSSMHSVILTDRWNRRTIIDKKLDKILVNLIQNVKQLLEPICHAWNFFYSELSDDDGAEEEGRDAITDPNISWYRIYSNH